MPQLKISDREVLNKILKIIVFCIDETEDWDLAIDAATFLNNTTLMGYCSQGSQQTTIYYLNDV